MAKCTGGTFNKLSRSFSKPAKHKARDKKRVSGATEKHEKAKFLSSGVRTKKHARKQVHRARMSEKFELEKLKAIEAEVAAEAATKEDVKMSKPKAKMSKKGRKSTGAMPMQE